MSTAPRHWPHPASLDDDELLKLCRVGRNRSSGPGGQHRNKVETEVIITHEPSGLQAHAGERRSQIENKHVALFRLRLVLAVSLRTPVPAGEVGSELWRSRLHEGKVSCNPEHHDYPAILAEALDIIAAANWDPKRAALRLGCSMSQLVKLVKDHPPALAMWNRERAARHEHPLH